MRDLRALATDVIGEHGGPADNWAFAISPLATPPLTNDFRIGSGHYYVDGSLCDVESTPVPVVVQAHSPGGVRVPRWTVDNVEYQLDQYVELFDDAVSPHFAPTVVQIKALDQTHQILMLQGTPRELASATAPNIRRVVTFKTQPDYPVSPDTQLVDGDYQVYVDVWERHITFVGEDSIREVAVDGPDTASRAKIVWQVKLLSLGGRAGTCLAPKEIRDRLRPDAAGRLKATAKRDSMSADPCIVPHDARYRGAENQLYRVEIHRPGPAWNGTLGGRATAATFKWSRENGSVIFPIVAGGGTTTVTLEHLGRGKRLGLAEGDWVEVLDDDYALSNSTRNLLQVRAIDRGSMMVALSGAPDANVGADPAKHPMLRRWDHKEGDPTEGGLQLATDGAVLIVERSEGGWLTLEDGVRIQFQVGPPANTYHTGDYWLIPARTATADVEWPRKPAKDGSGNPTVVPIALPPASIDHHYAPFAVVTLANGRITFSTECRKKFATLVCLTPP